MRAGTERNEACAAQLGQASRCRTLISEGSALLTTACLSASLSFSTCSTSMLVSRPPFSSILRGSRSQLELKRWEQGRAACPLPRAAPPPLNARPEGPVHNPHAGPASTGRSCQRTAC